MTELYETLLDVKEDEVKDDRIKELEKRIEALELDRAVDVMIKFFFVCCMILQAFWNLKVNTFLCNVDPIYGSFMAPNVNCGSEPVPREIITFYN